LSPGVSFNCRREPFIIVAGQIRDKAVLAANEHNADGFLILVSRSDAIRARDVLRKAIQSGMHIKLIKRSILHKYEKA